MRRQQFHLWLAGFASGALLLGCHNGARRSEYPDEPLLLSKPPVEGRIEVIDSAQTARSEPAPPPVPAEALASMPRPLPVGPATPLITTPTPEPPRPETAPPGPPARTATTTKTTPAADPVSSPRTPVAAIPASRIRATPVPTSPVPRPAEGPDLAPPVPLEPRATSSIYGHDAGYNWLQGTLDRHYRGHVYLRFCDPTVEDRFGGKVCLEEDPRLAECNDGDVIYVEGTLTNGSDANRDHWQQYPHFRIKSVRVVQRKN